jgi:hypothetical protein
MRIGIRAPGIFLDDIIGKRDENENFGFAALLFPLVFISKNSPLHLRTTWPGIK